MVSRRAAKVGHDTLYHIICSNVVAVVVQLLLQLRRNLASDGCRGIAQCTQKEKGKNGRQIQPKDRRNETTKEVQVRI